MESLMTKDEAALMHASFHKEIGKMKELIDKKTYINIRNDSYDADGSTPLLTSAKGGFLDGVKLLVENGADLNAYDTGRHTPLISAIQLGHTDIAHYLIEQKGILLNNPDIAGRTALDYATQSGDKKLIQSLVEKGALVDVQKPQANEMSMRLGKESTMTENEKSLMNASFHNDKERMKDLIDKGTYINVRDTSYDADGSSPILTSAKGGFLDGVKLLMENGADPNTFNTSRETALIAAIKLGHTEVAKYLIDQKGTLLDTKDAHGLSAVMHAAKKGNNEVLQYLVQKGANNSKLPTASFASQDKYPLPQQQGGKNPQRDVAPPSAGG